MRPLQAAHVLWSTAASLQTCDQSYGFLPCSATILGSLFLTLVYGYLLLCGANLIGDGGEHLMDLKLGSGIIGGAYHGSRCRHLLAHSSSSRSRSSRLCSSECAGLVLPVIGALPDSIIILVAGLHGSRAVAHEQVCTTLWRLAPDSHRPAVPVHVQPCGTAYCCCCAHCSEQPTDMTVLPLQIAIGMGTLAGSTIMLLTIVWGGSVLCGRCNLDQQVSQALHGRLLQMRGEGECKGRI